jgi:hypothetical protein
MNCLDKSQLKKMFAGDLNRQELELIAEHLSCCETCRRMVQDMPEWLKACAELSSSILSIGECPDYDQLSAYADGTLGAPQSQAIEAHANSCELCWRDLAKIIELRSHAAMREKVIVVRPTENSRAKAAIWLRRVVVAITASAAVAGVVLFMTQMGPTPTRSRETARITTPSPVKPVVTRPDPIVARQPRPRVLVMKPTSAHSTRRPAQVVVLKDGPYRVLKRNGKLIWANSNGVPVKSSLEARIAESIESKLRTGRVKPGRTVQVAMNSMRLRDSGDYTPSPTAPTPISPVGTIVLSDRPTIKWSKVDMGYDYRIVITDSEGRQIVDTVTQSNTFTPPTSLSRGQVYIWRVAVRFGEDADWENSRPSAFELISSADYNAIEKVKRCAKGSHLALGVAYEYFGLYEEAAQQYDMLRRENRSSQFARTLQVEAKAPEP